MQSCATAKYQLIYPLLKSYQSAPSPSSSGNSKASWSSDKRFQRSAIQPFVFWKVWLGNSSRVSSHFLLWSCVDRCDCVCFEIVKSSTTGELYRRTIDKRKRTYTLHRWKSSFLSDRRLERWSPEPGPLHHPRIHAVIKCVFVVCRIWIHTSTKLKMWAGFWPIFVLWNWAVFWAFGDVIWCIEIPFCHPLSPNHPLGAQASPRDPRGPPHLNHWALNRRQHGK